MIKPKRKTKDMVLCFECKQPIHFDDLAMITKDGLRHKGCCFRIFWLTQDNFIIGYESKVKSKEVGK